ncbi:VOC family protein [Acetobacterium wieringae]|uniref:VOC family protein n=1 Tax=Acetobacterium wieringae TaxID=52694 RepID=UPI003B9F3DDD
MKIGPYINFPGNCKEAVMFYTEIFKTDEPTIMTFGEMPEDPSFPMPDGIRDLVANAQMNIGGNMIMFSDVPPGMPFIKGNNITLIITHEDMEEIKRLFGLLSKGGTVEMLLQETFWSKAYGSLTDKFGIGWQMSAE